MYRKSEDQNHELEDQLDPNAEINPEDVPVEEEQKSEVARIVPAWLISFAVHATIGLIFSMVVFSQADKDEELPPMRITSIAPPPDAPKEEKKLERDLETKPEINVETESDVVAPITPVTVDTKIDTQDESEEPPRGREEAVSTSETGGSGAFMAIGAGGGNAGMFGSRTGNGKRGAIRRGGGSHGSESAVDAALRWFKKHQSPNGMWDTINYYQNCTEDPKCEKGGTNNETTPNVAATGYALLCYLGAGHDHRTPNKYRATIEKGIEWLKSQQKNGRFSASPHSNYEHAIATMAIAEAYAMSQDGELRAPAQLALDQIVAKQNKGGAEASSGGGGLGWDYLEPSSRNDSSVTGWCVMALKSGLAANLNIGNSLNGAKEWLKKTYEAANPDFAKFDPYTSQAKFPYYWVTGSATALAEDRVPMGALCAVFLGHHSGDPMLECLLNYVMANQTVTQYPTNTYFMYYNTLAVYQAGGERWKKWNNVTRDVLVKSQRQDGCFDGSWDIGPFIGSEVGRTISTAYCCLSLEVYYRYKQIAAKEEKEKKAKVK